MISKLFEHLTQQNNERSILVYTFTYIYIYIYSQAAVTAAAAIRTYTYFGAPLLLSLLLSLYVVIYIYIYILSLRSIPHNPFHPLPRTMRCATHFTYFYIMGQVGDAALAKMLEPKWNIDQCTSHAAS